MRRSPKLSQLLRVRDYVGEIVREDGRGVVRRMSSDPARLYGFNPSLVVCDELAQWQSRSLENAYAALTSGGGARTRPQLFAITTAGDWQSRHSSILGRLVDAAEQARDVERKPGLLVSRQPEARTLAWIYEAPTTDPRDTAKMLLANPAPWVSEEFLARQAAGAELSDADVLQLHGCVWSEASDTWLPAGAWDAVAAAAAEGKVKPDARVVLGFDGSYKRDATALIGATIEEHPHVFVVEVWERPAGAPDDWRIPRVDVERVLADAIERFQVVEVAADPPGWHRELEDWTEAYPDLIAEYPTNQAARMAPAVDKFRSAVLEGGLTHDGSSILARHVANAAVRETRSGMLLTKAVEGRKIDAAIAAVLAYDRAAWHHAQGEREPLVAWA